MNTILNDVMLGLLCIANLWRDVSILWYWLSMHSTAQHYGTPLYTRGCIDRLRSVHTRWSI